MTDGWQMIVGGWQIDGGWRMADLKFEMGVFYKSLIRHL
jgi:hypothetical protein